MTDILMTPDVCMQFLVWSFYYHDIMPEAQCSYSVYNKFSASDSARLDEIKDAMFKCFDEYSVARACQQLLLAKESGEPCPYSQAELDRAFAAVQ